MNMSDNGINMLKRLEGCVKIGNRHVIYDDKTGKPVDVNKPLPSGATIGYGHLIKNGEDFRNGISESKATELLRSDIMMSEQGINNLVCVPLNQNQFDALVLLVFNIGIKNFEKSTVLKYLNNHDYKSNIYTNLESAWMSWNKSNGYIVAGLTNRRKQEWILFTNRGIW
jgi:type VI secretion system secreted protein VgrG